MLHALIILFDYRDVLSIESTTTINNSKQLARIYLKKKEKI